MVSVWWENDWDNTKQNQNTKKNDDSLSGDIVEEFFSKLLGYGNEKRQKQDITGKQEPTH